MNCDCSETFRLIAEVAGEDGTDPDSWRAMTYPTPGEYALRAVRNLRTAYEDATGAPEQFAVVRRAGIPSGSELLGMDPDWTGGSSVDDFMNEVRGRGRD